MRRIEKHSMSREIHGHYFPRKKSTGNECGWSMSTNPFVHLQNLFKLNSVSFDLPRYFFPVSLSLPADENHYFLRQD